MKRYHLLYRGTQMILRTFDVATLGQALLDELEFLLLFSRDDAVYLNAAVIRFGEAMVLAPSPLVSYLMDLGGRVRREHIHLPSARSVAVDPETGQVLPLQPMLEIPDDAVSRLDVGARPETWVRIQVPTTVEVACTYVLEGDAVVQPVSRATALHHFAAAVLNLELLEKRALEGLARLLQLATCYGYIGLGATPPAQVLEALQTACARRG